MKNIQDTVDAACRQLEVTVRDMGVELSFDMESVPVLEEIVLAVKQERDDSALNGACFMVGCYLGEIVRRRVRGEWVGSVDGPPVVEFGGTQLSPIGRVMKFAASPEEEGLTFYARALAGQA